MQRFSASLEFHPTSHMRSLQASRLSWATIDQLEQLIPWQPQKKTHPQATVEHYPKIFMLANMVGQEQSNF